MGMLFAALPVVGLIAVGALSVYVGRQLASRASHLPTRVALFFLGALSTAALIAVVLSALGLSIVLFTDIAVPTIGCVLIVALMVWIIRRPDIFGRSNDE